MRELELLEIQAVTGGNSEVPLLPISLCCLQGMVQNGVLTALFLCVLGYGAIGRFSPPSVMPGTTTTLAKEAWSMVSTLVAGFCSGALAYAAGTMFSTSSHEH